MSRREWMMREILAVSLVAGGRALSAQVAMPALKVVPDLRIDSTVGGGTQLTWVTVSPQGVIVTADATERKLLFVGPDGKVLGTFDGTANGMGDFGAHLWLGDTLMVLDPSTKKYTYIGPDRAAHGTVAAMAWGGGPALTGTSAAAVMGTVRTEAIFGDGSVLAPTDSAHLPPAEWSARPNAADRQAIARVSNVGQAVKVIAWVPRDDCMFDYRVPNLVGTLLIPQCPRLLRTSSGDGRPMAFVKAHAMGADSATYDVAAIRANGDTAFSRRYPFTPQPSDSVRAAAELNAMVRSTEPRSPEAAELIRTQVHPSPIAPPFVQALVGRDGTVWLRGNPAAAGTVWTVLDPAGNVMGTVTLASNLAVQDADRSTIWAIETTGRATSTLGATGGPPSTTRSGVVVRLRVVAGSGVP